jgi:hypothetical protein
MLRRSQASCRAADRRRVTAVERVKAPTRARCSYQGRGLGAGLLRDAILRTVQAADIAGIRAILVHAISEEAKWFYERHGFVASPIDPITLMVTCADAKRSLGA